MTRLEKMRELLSLPVEELAEKITTENGVAKELKEMWANYYEPDPGAKFCLEHYEGECCYLDDAYDPECREWYGSCACEGPCPYGVDREEVVKNAIVESLNEEVEE